MTEPVFDHDRLDVYRVSEPLTGYHAGVEYEHEHRDAEHEHDEKPEPSDATERRSWVY
jgi:hypothetical protein